MEKDGCVGVGLTSKEKGAEEGGLVEEKVVGVGLKEAKLKGAEGGVEVEGVKENVDGKEEEEEEWVVKEEEEEEGPAEPGKRGAWADP